MKKVALLTMAIAALSIASCQKAARTCTCNGTTTIHEVVKTTAGAAVSETTTTSPEAYVEVLTSATKKTAKGKKTCMSRTLTETDSYTAGGNVTTDDITQEFTCTVK